MPLNENACPVIFCARKYNPKIFCHARNYNLRKMRAEVVEKVNERFPNGTGSSLNFNMRQELPNPTHRLMYPTSI